MARPGPLAGIRVLDIATMIAAPLTASILGDYGADVVKIEMPGVGDPVRKLGEQRQGVGLYWKSLGRNKRSVALDLRVPEAQELLLKWLPQFDVLVENFRPGTLDRWNLGEARLREINPGLIIFRMTGFGQTGPYRNRQGFGTLAETMSGVGSVLVRGLRGFPRSRPALPSFPMGDVTAGIMGVNGILAALLHRQKTGKGETIDLAIYESLLKFMELEILKYDDSAEEVDPETLPRRPDAVPRGTYRSKDGHWVALSGSSQAVAERFLKLLGGDDMLNDPRFRTNELRVQHVEELDDILEAWCTERTQQEIIEQMSAAGCAVGPVETVKTLLANPQIVAREAIIEVEDPDIGPLRMTNVIPKFEGHPRTSHRPASSRVGGDTLETLKSDLNLDAAALARLRSIGAIGGE